MQLTEKANVKAVNNEAENAESLRQITVKDEKLTDSAAVLRQRLSAAVLRQRLSWRKEPNATGLARVCQGTRGFQLRRGKETLAHVARLSHRNENDHWYWYGMGRNTASAPALTADQAKAEAMAWVKSKLAVTQ